MDLKTITWILGIAGVLCSFGGCGSSSNVPVTAISLWTADPAEKYSLPEWRIDRGQLSQSLSVPSQIKFRINTFGSDTSSGFESRKGVFVAGLQVSQSDRLRIRASSSSGWPIVVVADRYMHALDFQGLHCLPMHPVAYAMGSEREISCSFSTRTSGLWQVWLWVLPSRLEDQEFPQTDDSLAFDIELLEKMVEKVSPLERAWSEENSGQDDVEINLSVDSASSETEPAIPVLPKEYADSHGAADSLFEEEVTFESTIHILDSLTGLGYGRCRKWAEGSYSGRDSSMQIEAIEVMANRPVIRAELQKELDGSDLAVADSSYMVLRQLIRGGELGICRNRISRILARSLRGIGGISAALVDRNGFVLASTVPFVLQTLKDQASWSVLTSSRSIQWTQPYLLKGFPFRLRKIAIPVLRQDGNSEPIGWILFEIFAGRV